GVRGALALAAGLAGCTGGNSDYPITSPPGGLDASGAMGDAGPDAAPDAPAAAIDARPDAAVPTADLSLAISDAPDPVAASSIVIYTIDVTNHGELDAKNVVVTQRLPSGNVQFQTASGIGWSCSAA